MSNQNSISYTADIRPRFVLTVLKNRGENNGMAEIASVTPTPGQAGCQVGTDRSSEAAKYLKQ